MALIDVQIVFENDALFASFTDGAGLELSPCSSTFLFHHAKNSSSHKVYGNNVSTLNIHFLHNFFCRPPNGSAEK